MVSCPDCLAASTSHTWGGYHSNCNGCEIRAIAQSPRRIREAAYAKWARELGEERMQEKRRAVVAEYQRIDGLRGNQ